MLKTLTLFFLSIFSGEEGIPYTKEYILPTEQIPLNIYWISQDNILLSYLNTAEIFNLEGRVRNKLDVCSNCIYGYDREFLRCEYIHREISSMEEFSTTVSMYNSRNELLFTKDIFPTVIPHICKREYILLKSAYSFLEQKTYLIDTRTEEFSIHERKKQRLDIKALPKYKEISIGKEWLVLLNEENLLYVYRREL